MIEIPLKARSPKNNNNMRKKNLKKIFKKSTSRNVCSVFSLSGLLRTRWGRNSNMSRYKRLRNHNNRKIIIIIRKKIRASSSVVNLVFWVRIILWSLRNLWVFLRIRCWIVRIVLNSKINKTMIKRKSRRILKNIYRSKRIPINKIIKIIIVN